MLLSATIGYYRLLSAAIGKIARAQDFTYQLKKVKQFEGLGFKPKHQHI